MVNKKSNSKLHALITGGAGFVGSHLAENLLKNGYKVTVIDDLSTGFFKNISHLNRHDDFSFAIDSITNEVVLDRLVSECDVIFHLAAAVGVMLVVDQPVHTIETNVMGTEAVLKAAQRYRVKVLVASTSEVYGKGNGIPFKENDDVVIGATCNSRWAYATSKMLDEFLALAYFKKKNLPVVIFRLFNTVGPRQTGRYGMVIPRFIEQALSGEKLTVYGDGKQSRCFMHVQDAVDALIKLAECPQAVGGVFNIGSTEKITIHDLAKLIIEFCNNYKINNNTPVTTKKRRERIQFIPYEKAYSVGFEDMRHRKPDILKIKKLTGWQAKFDLKSVIADILEQQHSSKTKSIK